MQARVWYTALLLSTAIALPMSAQTTGTIAFTNVNVVPMDTERILARQTVIVVDGQVSVVGPSDEVPIPAGAMTIEGAGGFLMPGLADLHVHVRNEEDLVVYVANGVTTVLDMGGPAVLLDWRNRIAAGELFGPRLLVSRFIDGGGGRAGLVETVAEARTAIRSAAESGYDYIKAYNSLTTAQFDAIVEEADRAGLSIIGHGVRDPGLEHILESGMSMVAHGEEYIYTFFQGCSARDRIPEAIELTRRTGAYVLPNLSAYEIMTLQWGKPPVVDSLLNRPERRFLHPNFQRSWRGGRYTGRGGSIAPCFAFLRDLTKAFSDAGIPLLLGTDSPGIPGMYPGYSIHNDLRNMVEAGLTPYQALAAGTREAGLFLETTLDDPGVSGVVRPGARADLILIEENPLEDVSRVRRPLGVMLNGSWWTADRLEAKLETLAKTYDERPPAGRARPATRRGL